MAWLYEYVHLMIKYMGLSGLFNCSSTTYEDDEIHGT